jgi:Co/Zn/Cd efflux system component
MNRTTYRVERMDCAAEERLVRMALEDVACVERLGFDLPARRLVVVHTGHAQPITAALDRLGLGSAQTGDTTAATDADAPATTQERAPLRIALGINASFFVIEFVAGLLSGSMGLVADSLDNLADALVYALSLAAVGGSAARKKGLARTSGYLQIGLAVFGLFEVVRRFLTSEGVPDVATMIVVSSLTLLGNVATLLVLRRARSGGSGEAHVEASWIFTSNDVKVNGLVIASALVVWATGSALPDLVAGALVFVIVAGGARRILALAR